MIEGLLMLAMLVFVFFLLLQAKRLSSPKKKHKDNRLLAIFDFNLTIDSVKKEQ
jgi:hypothetical protein